MFVLNLIHFIHNLKIQKHKMKIISINGCSIIGQVQRLAE